MIMICFVSRNLKIGYFSQHHVDQLDLTVSSIELLLNKFPGNHPRPWGGGGALPRPASTRADVPTTGQAEEEYRHQLGRYGITGELATRPVASLSGGQKSRVAFAQMTMPW